MYRHCCPRTIRQHQSRCSPSATSRSLAAARCPTRLISLSAQCARGASSTTHSQLTRYHAYPCHRCSLPSLSRPAMGTVRGRSRPTASGVRRQRCSFTRDPGPLRYQCEGLSWTLTSPCTAAGFSISATLLSSSRPAFLVCCRVDVERVRCSVSILLFWLISCVSSLCVI